MRPSTACSACRNGKRKCRPSRNPQTKTCGRCERMKLACSLVAAVDDLTTTDSTAQDASPASQTLSALTGRRSNCVFAEPELPEGDPSWREDMVSNYFSVVHDKHHSIFHRPLFESEMRDGLVPDVLSCAVLSLGSRFTTIEGRIMPAPSQQRILGDRLAESAMRCLDMRDISLRTVQACILLGTLCYVDGKGEAESLYFAAALRLALVLDLPHRSCSTALERESNLRVWWTLYMADIWSSVGLRLPRQCSWRSDVDLPADEAWFLSLSHDTQPHPGKAQPIGLWGEMSRLTCIWGKIQDLLKTSVELQHSVSFLLPAIDALDRDLRDWCASLSPILTETPENLEWWTQKGLGSCFAALHLGFHYYHEVLFYPLMGNSHREPSPQVISYAERCAAHARAFGDLLYLSEQTEGSRCLYTMLGHMLVVTSTVYMHRLFFDQQGGEAPLMRERLKHNFEILIELQAHWHTLETALARLRVFHNACLYSIEHSFDMDQWMITFIFEHGHAVPEKYAMLPDGTTQDLVGDGGPDQDELQDWYMAFICE